MMFRAGYAASDLFYRGMVFILSAFALYLQGAGFYAEFARDIAVFNLLYNISVLSLPTFLVRQTVKSCAWPSETVIAYLSIVLICAPAYLAAIIFFGVKFEIVLAVYGAITLEIFFARVRILDGKRFLSRMIFIVGALFLLSIGLLLAAVQEFRFWALFVAALMLVGLVSLDLRRLKRAFEANGYVPRKIGPLIKDLLVFGVPISIHQLIFWFRSGFDKIYLFSKINDETFAAYGAIFQVLGLLGVLLGVFTRTYQAQLYRAMEGFAPRQHMRAILSFILVLGIFIFFSLFVSNHVLTAYFPNLISPQVVSLIVAGGCLHFVNQIFSFAYAFFGRTLAFLIINSVGLLVYLSVVTLGGANLVAFSAAYFSSTLVISLALSIYLFSILDRR